MAVDQKKRMKKIDAFFKKRYPHASCSLNYTTPLQLLLATILSAQCTDARVNKVVPKLFALYPTLEQLADAPLPDIEKIIYSTGFYRTKAKSLKNCCAHLVEHHHGEVPATMKELTALAGVGRKTANVILGNIFGAPDGVVVDTHVSRISQRLALTQNKTPEKIERDLAALLPQKEWTGLSHRMILFGRELCTARKPHCGNCPLNTDCPFYLRD